MIKIKITDVTTGIEIENPIYCMNEWYRTWRDYDNGIKMDKGSYTIESVTVSETAQK